MKRSWQLLGAILLLLNFGVVALVPAGEAQLRVEPSKSGPEISPYLYGQFIEHLGRCIRDGVWAEKLRDRKFFLEPAKSPWQVVKPTGAVFEIFHDTAGAYAGDHCMALWLRDGKTGSCGIRQGDLGLVAGKEYVGYAVLACPTGKGRVEARLSWGSGEGESRSITLSDIGRGYRKIPFRFQAGKTTETGSLSLLLSEPAQLWVGCVSLMPADNVDGMRADTLALIRKLNPPITRWPGGNFVSGYNWKDGIGERDRRPPRWERAWNDVEDNDFGIDEFMRFCAEVETEPYLAVNTGLGSVQEVLDEVEYVTGWGNTRWGGERARNGSRQPYPVVWWGVGNEMFGDWQLGHIPVERYAIRHNAFVAAMKAKNPTLKIIAVGAPGPWNDKLLPLCSDNMDLLSGHYYTERKLKLPFSTEDARRYEENFAAYSGDVAAGIRRIVSDFRGRLGKGDAKLDRVRLAIDEWGIVRDWNPAPDGPGIGAFEHYYTLGDTIASGRALHELLRSADVVTMANWAQTVNVIAAIKTSRNHAVMDPVGHLLALYRAELGGRLVPANVSGTECVDVVATMQEGVLALGLINFSNAGEVALRIDAGEFRPKEIKGWRIDGPSLGSINVPGQAECVRTTEVGLVDASAPVILPKHSITVVRMQR